MGGDGDTIVYYQQRIVLPPNHRHLHVCSLTSHYYEPAKQSPKETRQGQTVIKQVIKYTATSARVRHNKHSPHQLLAKPYTLLWILQLYRCVGREARQGDLPMARGTQLLEKIESLLGLAEMAERFSCMGGFVDRKKTQICGGLES